MARRRKLMSQMNREIITVEQMRAIDAGSAKAGIATRTLWRMRTRGRRSNCARFFSGRRRSVRTRK